MVYFCHNRGLDKVPAMIKIYLTGMGFLLPACSSTLSSTEEQFVPVALAGGRIKFEPGYDKSPRPQEEGSTMVQKPKATAAIKQESEIGENITYLDPQHICWGKCKGFLYDKKDMAMRLYKSFDGGSYATMLWQIKDMRSPTKIKFYHRCPSRCDAVQAEITSKGKKWLRSKGMQNSYRRRLQPRRRLQLKKNGLSKVAMRSQLMKRAIWLG